VRRAFWRRRQRILAAYAVFMLASSALLAAGCWLFLLLLVR